MAWDFSTEPEFEEKLEWMRGFVRDEIIPLETLQLGAYLGAADALVSEPLRGIVARIAANEAQHLTIFAPFQSSFPVALTIEQASDTLSRYTS